MKLPNFRRIIASDYDQKYKDLVETLAVSINQGMDSVYDALNKKITLKTISNNWIDFLKNSKITNTDYKEIINEYKDNENAFIYLDPPYVDSYNTGYVGYQKGHYDEESKVIDNTKMYIDLLDILSCKCKVLFSINENEITKHVYKDFYKRNL